MELWDLYDRDRNPLHEAIIRRPNVKIPKGSYHIVVECIIVDKRGRMLITQRAEGKHHAGLWECTAGSIVCGEDSVTGVVREVFEETGLTIEPENLILIKTEVTDCVIRDTYLYCMPTVNLKKIRCQEGETAGARMIPLLDFQQGIIDKKDLGAGFVPAQFARLNAIMGRIMEESKRYYAKSENAAKKVEKGKAPARKKKEDAPVALKEVTKLGKIELHQPNADDETLAALMRSLDGFSEQGRRRAYDDV